MKVEILRPFAVSGFRGQSGDVIDIPFGLAEALILDGCAKLWQAPNVVEDVEDEDDAEEKEPETGAEVRTSIEGLDAIFDAQNEQGEVPPAVSPAVEEPTAEATSGEAQVQKPKAKK